MAYTYDVVDWDVLYDGVSIKEKVSSFSISASVDSYVRELDLDIEDPSFQSNFDWTQLPSTPKLEVKIKKNDSWYTIGKFFLEKPTINIAVDGTFLPGLWGRSQTAVLGTPFATTIDKTWEEDTTFYAICNEVLADSGISISVDKAVSDFTVYAYSFAAEKITPIEVIRKLCEFAGCYLTTDGYTTLYVKQTDYSLSSPSKTISDAEILGISTEVDYPEFGNRVKIAPTAGANLNVKITPLNGGECLPADASIKATWAAVVTDSEGVPVEDEVLVEWSEETGNVNFEPAHTYTSTLTVENEVRASSWKKIQLDHTINNVIGVWAAGDKQKSDNLYLSKGGSFEGRTINFNKSLKYCDQKVKVKYSVAGAVQTYVSSGAKGDYKIKATASGATDTETLYVDNVCACGSTIYMDTIPSASVCYASPVYILTVVEMYGRAGSGTVDFRLEGCGQISHQSKTLKQVNIRNEQQAVKNVIEGTSQIEVKYFPNPDFGVSAWVVDEEGNKENAVILTHNSGKLFDLGVEWPDGTEFKVDYKAKGACLLMWQEPTIPGTINISNNCKATVYANVKDGTEDGLTQSINLTAKECRTPDEDRFKTDDEDDLEDDVNFDNDSGSENDGLATGQPCCQSGQFGDYPWLNQGDDCYNCSQIETQEACNNAFVHGCTWSNLYSEDGEYRCWCPETPVSSWGAAECSQADLAQERDVATQVGEGGVGEDQVDNLRFGTFTVDDCPPKCTCESICEAELSNYGRLQDDSTTIHEYLVDIQGYEDGSPDYQSAYEQERAARKQQCLSDCNVTRNQVCSELTLTGPDVLDPEETALYTDNWGNEGTITSVNVDGEDCPEAMTLLSQSEDGYLMQMDSNAGGTIELTVTYSQEGSQISDTIEVRSTGGTWEVYWRSSDCNGGEECYEPITDGEATSESCGDDFGQPCICGRTVVNGQWKVDQAATTAQCGSNFFCNEDPCCVGCGGVMEGWRSPSCGYGCCDRVFSTESGDDCTTGYSVDRWTCN